MARLDQVLTANRLRDGAVVYWSSGSWTGSLETAQVFSDKVSAEAALERAAKDVAGRIVVNPYLFEVRRDEGRLMPLREREVIRAAGPSVRSDLGKQAHHVPL